MPPGLKEILLEAYMVDIQDFAEGLRNYFLGRTPFVLIRGMCLCSCGNHRGQSASVKFSIAGQGYFIQVDELAWNHVEWQTGLEELGQDLGCFRSPRVVHR